MMVDLFMSFNKCRVACVVFHINTSTITNQIKTLQSQTTETTLQSQTTETTLQSQTTERTLQSQTI
jgi:hypothetical protein